MQDGIDWIVKSMQAVMTKNPYAIEMHREDTSFYCGRITALSVQDHPEDVRYGHNDVIFITSRSVNWGEVKMSVEVIEDVLLKAEVQRYRCVCAELTHLQQEIDALMVKSMLPSPLGMEWCIN